MKIRTIFSIMLLICDLTVAQDYYPLKVGYTWVYNYYLTGHKGPEWKNRNTIISYDKQYDSYILREVSKLGNAYPVTTDFEIDKRDNAIIETTFKGGILGSPITAGKGVFLELPLRIGANWRKDSDNGWSLDYTVVNKIDLTVEGISYKEVFVVKLIKTSLNPKYNKELIYYQYYAPEIGLIQEEQYMKEKEKISSFGLTKKLIQFIKN
jgi:hypothetical protein